MANVKGIAYCTSCSYSESALHVGHFFLTPLRLLSSAHMCVLCYTPSKGLSSSSPGGVCVHMQWGGAVCVCAMCGGVCGLCVLGRMFTCGRCVCGCACVWCAHLWHQCRGAYVCMCGTCMYAHVHVVCVCMGAV